MGLESTMICFDNSEFMRNGDYTPNRLQAQQEAVKTVCRYKLLANPENTVGLITLANRAEVLATLTTDAWKILTSLHKVQPKGYINFLTGIRIAHLSLKHKHSRLYKMRIVAFVGSPIDVDEKEAIKVAKRLKKENVNMDIVHFGETEGHQGVLEAMVNTINGKDGTGSHLITIPPSPDLADALRTSPVLQGEDGNAPASFSSAGAGFDFVDPNEDPELALALRVSMEEQRQRQQEEERRTQDSTKPSDSNAETPMETGDEAQASADGAPAEDEMLRKALEMSLEPSEGASAETGTTSASSAPTTNFPDFSSMSEEEQLAYAMQISLQQGMQTKEEPMEVDTKPTISEKTENDPDFSEVMADQKFLTDVLKGLPGVNPDSKAVKDAVGSLSAQKDKKKDSDEKKEEK